MLEPNREAKVSSVCHLDSCYLPTIFVWFFFLPLPLCDVTEFPGYQPRHLKLRKEGMDEEGKKCSVPRQENNSVKDGGDSTGRAAHCVALHTRWHSAHSASTSGCTSNQEIPGIRTTPLMGLCNQQLCRHLLQVPGRKEVWQQSNCVASTQVAHPVTLVASLQGVLWSQPSLAC